MTKNLVLPKAIVSATEEVQTMKGVSEQVTTPQVLPSPRMSPDGDSDQFHGVTQTEDVTNGADRETTLSELPMAGVSDARPDPKPRKYPHLWQSYLWWYTLMELRKAYTLRISSIERGKSSLDIITEKDMAQQLGMAYLIEAGVDVKQLEKAAQKGLALDLLLVHYKKAMVNFGSLIPVWEWVTNIKGLGEGSLAAQLLAQIDDIEKFDTVAKLWRFAGYAIIDGKAEKNQKGEKSHFNRKLKGICFNIADQFIKQQTPYYVDIYYAEKERQRALNPDILCRECGCKWEECQSKKKHVKIFTDAHIHNRAWRKMIKQFLCDLWIEWKK